MTKQKTVRKKASKDRPVEKVIAPVRKVRVSPVPGGVKVVVREGATLIMEGLSTVGAGDDAASVLNHLVATLAERGVVLSRGQQVVCMRALGRARGRGRPRVSDPRISTHLQLAKAERELCFAAAEHLGLSFAAWARMVLLAKGREVMRTDLPSPSNVESGEER